MSCSAVIKLCLNLKPLSVVMRNSSRLYCYQMDNYDIPRYTKINGWDKENSNLKTLGKILSSKRDRLNSDSLVLEGTRIIKDAISHGCSPSVVVFSREKLIWELGLPKDTEAKLYHIPYNNIKLWTDMTTSPGIMAAFSKEEITEKVKSCQTPCLPLTLVCDNIRQPDNLGAVLRVAAAAGAHRVVLTPGCVDAWAPKVVRAGAGAHFLIPIVEGVGWDTFSNRWPLVVLADLLHEEQEEVDSSYVDRKLEEMEAVCREEGDVLSYQNQDQCMEYRKLPLRTKLYSEFELEPGYEEVVLVVGGETEGVSNAAYMFCHHHNGMKLHIPLWNQVNSLNVISAATLVLFKVQEALARRQGDKQDALARKECNTLQF